MLQSELISFKPRSTGGPAALSARHVVVWRCGRHARLHATRQFHASLLRSVQYSSGSDRQTSMSSVTVAASNLASSSVAAKLECRCCTHAAPLNTMASNGCANAHANASASTVVPSCVPTHGYTPVSASRGQERVRERLPARHVPSLPWLATELVWGQTPGWHCDR
jgi:hypothetical protein